MQEAGNEYLSLSNVRVQSNWHYKEDSTPMTKKPAIILFLQPA
jgi:hypothetical protein